MRLCVFIPLFLFFFFKGIGSGCVSVGFVVAELDGEVSLRMRTCDCFVFISFPLFFTYL